jgi:hypothetical protein
MGSAFKKVLTAFATPFVTGEGLTGLDAIAGALERMTPAAKQLGEAVNAALPQVVEWFEKLTNPENIDKFVGNVQQWAKSAVDMFHMVKAALLDVLEFGKQVWDFFSQQFGPMLLNWAANVEKSGVVFGTLKAFGNEVSNLASPPEIANIFRLQDVLRKMGKSQEDLNRIREEAVRLHKPYVQALQEEVNRTMGAGRHMDAYRASRQQATAATTSATHATRQNSQATNEASDAVRRHEENLREMHRRQRDGIEIAKESRAALLQLASSYYAAAAGAEALAGAAGVKVRQEVRERVAATMRAGTSAADLYDRRESALDRQAGRVVSEVNPQRSQAATAEARRRVAEEMALRGQFFGSAGGVLGMARGDVSGASLGRVDTKEQLDAQLARGREAIDGSAKRLGTTLERLSANAVLPAEARLRGLEAQLEVLGELPESTAGKTKVLESSIGRLGAYIEGLSTREKVLRDKAKAGDATAAAAADVAKMERQAAQQRLDYQRDLLGRIRQFGGEAADADRNRITGQARTQRIMAEMERKGLDERVRQQKEAWDKQAKLQAEALERQQKAAEARLRRIDEVTTFQRKSPAARASEWADLQREIRSADDAITQLRTLGPQLGPNAAAAMQWAEKNRRDLADREKVLRNGEPMVNMGKLYGSTVGTGDVPVSVLPGLIQRFSSIFAQQQNKQAEEDKRLAEQQMEAQKSAQRQVFEAALRSGIQRPETKTDNIMAQILGNLGLGDQDIIQQAKLDQRASTITNAVNATGDKLIDVLLEAQRQQPDKLRRALVADISRQTAEAR